MDNCLNCENSYTKDLFDDGSEIVYICNLDNHYIGYPEEASKETCEKWKEK